MSTHFSLKINVIDSYNHALSERCLNAIINIPGIELRLTHDSQFSDISDMHLNLSTLVTWAYTSVYSPGTG